jgi:hypothetical protein
MFFIIRFLYNIIRASQISNNNTSSLEFEINTKIILIFLLNLTINIFINRLKVLIRYIFPYLSKLIIRDYINNRDNK